MSGKALCECQAVRVGVGGKNEDSNRKRPGGRRIEGKEGGTEPILGNKRYREANTKGRAQLIAANLILNTPQPMPRWTFISFLSIWGRLTICPGLPKTIPGDTRCPRMCDEQTLGSVTPNRH